MLDRYIWSSDAGGSFAISEDKGENEPLGRGTLIKIHLKPEALVRWLRAWAAPLCRAGLCPACCAV